MTDTGRESGPEASERLHMLEQLEDWIEKPMLILSFAWLVLVLVELVWGAGGMLAFEPAADVEGGFRGYVDALWWTAMLLTSIGSEYWPQSAEGRLLCFLLSLYGLAVFGCITASFASFFVGRDAASADAEVVGAPDIAALRTEIAALRGSLRPGEGRVTTAT